MMARAREITLQTVISVLAAGSAAIPAAQWALAGEIAKQVSPLLKSQRVLLIQAIEDYNDTVAALEFKRDSCELPTCWTADDAKNLARLQNKIVATREALKLLE